MKMKGLMAVVALGACAPSLAVEIYNKGNTTLAIGGYVDVGVGQYFENTTEVHEVSPRLNISGTHDLGNGVTVDAMGEWGINFLDGGDTTFTTRLGYIGVTHEHYGRLVAGTQWSPYYDVAGVADLPIAFANDFLYSQQGDVGSARADKMLSYRKQLKVNEDLSFQVGLGWQGKQAVEDPPKDAEFDARGQIALSTTIAGFGLGYTYSGGDVDFLGLEHDAHSHLFSAFYGTYGQGLYTALVYGMNEYFYTRLGSTALYADTSQYEALLAYGFENSLTLSINYESVEDDKNNLKVYSQSALQAEYYFHEDFAGFAAYQFDLGNDIGESENDYWTIGVRYFL
ncbi:Outer membrane porin PhoE [Vibrio stylophorae]|uniref:Outer membrane porin PhoE n=1 Tax=Vibrio stylophorae TaxID=659351 RepID=A0ABM8ZWU8_9VIBR|nr:porin [Vibrio stylophorae]CAH0535118.1 Outer membrane porin PhoE [Vibrio stylophorae]